MNGSGRTSSAPTLTPVGASTSGRANSVGVNNALRRVAVQVDLLVVDVEIPGKCPVPVLAWNRRHGHWVVPPTPMFIEQSPARWALPVTPTSTCHSPALRFSLSARRPGMVIR